MASIDRPAGPGVAPSELRRSSDEPRSGGHGDDDQSFVRRHWRPLAFLVVLGAAWLVGWYFDVGDYLSKENVRQWVSEAGWWGPLVFIGVFTVGQLVGVPGIVFVAAAVLAWGKWPGIGASYGATIVSSTAGFLMARLIGGDAMHQVKWKWVQKMLERVDRRPILSVTALVAVFWMAPPINYALGMTRVKLWQFVAGTAIGLIPALLATGFFFDWITRTFL